jgi:hypothetical protein
VLLGRLVAVLPGAVPALLFVVLVVALTIAAGAVLVPGDVVALVVVEVAENLGGDPRELLVVGLVRGRRGGRRGHVLPGLLEPLQQRQRGPHLRELVGRQISHVRRLSFTGRGRAGRLVGGGGQVDHQRVGGAVGQVDRLPRLHPGDPRVPRQQQVLHGGRVELAVGPVVVLPDPHRHTQPRVVLDLLVRRVRQLHRGVQAVILGLEREHLAALVEHGHGVVVGLVGQHRRDGVVRGVLESLRDRPVVVGGERQPPPTHLELPDGQHLLAPQPLADLLGFPGGDRGAHVNGLPHHAPSSCW